MKSSIGLVSIATALVAFAVSTSAGLAMGNERATATTAHYQLELDIGASEEMYSKADALRTKPTTGEIMVSGQMAGGMPAMKDMPGMSASGSMAAAAMYHFELHVRSKATGKAVLDAKVSITVSGLAAKQPIIVPIAVMYGIAQGKEDWHYGNNVQLAPGHYIVAVSANGEAAKFNIAVPPV